MIEEEEDQKGGKAEAQAKQVWRKKRFWCMTDNDCIDLMGKKKKGGWLYMK